MSILEAIILGAVQGLGEFLPISSSGHLLFAQLLMGFDRSNEAYMLLDVLLHVGTLIPILIVFWKDWVAMLLHPVQQKGMWGMLILASLPALAVHLLGFDDGFGTGWFLGVSFLLTAVLLLLTESISARKANGREQPGFVNALVMGCFQAVAILPGVSRSGSTITGGVLSGMNRKGAAKFSFMMCAPAIAGSLLLEGKEAIEQNWFASFELLPMLVGILTSALVGYAAIRFMLELINRISLNWFALYVAVLGLIFLVMQLVGMPSFPPFHPNMAEGALLHALG